MYYFDNNNYSVGAMTPTVMRRGKNLSSRIKSIFYVITEELTLENIIMYIKVLTTTWQIKPL